MTLDPQFGLAAILVVVILLLLHQWDRFRQLSNELRESVSKLKTQVADVDRLATALQESVGQPHTKPNPESVGGSSGLQGATGDGGAADPPPPDAAPAEISNAGQEAYFPQDDMRTLSPGLQPPSAKPGDVARQLYAEWCSDGRQPDHPATVELTALRFAGEERTSEYSVPTPLFEDHPQTGEFVRISAAGAEKGLAFPHPRAYFNERVHRILFPQLTTATYQPQQLASVSPVQIKRRPDGKWQKVE